MSNKRKKRVSLKDIASQLDVSVTLVSAVLNDKADQYRINEKTAAKVIKVAKELNYSPNLLARGLRTGNSRLIGLIVTDISNPFYSSIARIIENKTNKTHYEVIFGSSDEDVDKTKQLIDVMLDKGVAGLIIVPCEGSNNIIADLHERNIPVVLIDRYFPDLDVSYSCLNNHSATRLATSHLIKQGFERIALITYESGLTNIKDRTSGYQETMTENSLHDLINVKSLDITNQLPEMEKALELIVNDMGYDAIIFVTNSLLVSGLRVLEKMNKIIPEDVAVVGFYGSELFDLYYSPITYIKQPIELIAEEAVKILTDKIEYGEKSNFSKLFKEPELIVQKSSIRLNN